MDPTGLILFIAAVILMMGISHTLNRRQHQRNAAYAHQQGWTYRATGNDIAPDFGAIPHIPARASFHNVYAGTHRNIEFIAFEITWRTANREKGRRSTTSRSIVAIREQTTLPDIYLAPDHIVLRGLDTLTGNHIAIGHPPFDNRYRVLAHDREFAGWFLHPDLVNHMLTATGDNATPPWGITRGKLFTLYHSPLWPHQLTTRLDELIDLAARVPTQAWELRDPHAALRHRLPAPPSAPPQH